MSEGTTNGKWEALLLLGAGVFALGFQLWLPSTHVDESDYQAVAQVLAAERAPGDVVLLAPWWTERARIYVPEGLPVVGYQGSDGASLEPHPRIWVLSQPRQPRAGIGTFESAFLPGRREDGAAREFGNLRLQRFVNGRHRPTVLDGADSLASAQVYVEQPDGQRQNCTWNGQVHQCGNGKTVIARWHEVHFAPYRCLRMEPPGGAAKLVVEYSFPGAGAVSLEAGYVADQGANLRAAPMEVALEVDGNAQPLTLRPGDELMNRREGGSARAGSRVSVSVKSDNPGGRAICAVLRVAGGAP